MTQPNPQDVMMHITLAGGAVRGLLTVGTRTVSQGAAIHLTSHVVTAAFGRTLMGTAMMGAMLKEPNASVTVTVNGGGPVGRIVCVADANGVRGCVDVPNVELPLRPDGKLDVGTAVGRAGRMTVVKDLGLKSPYVGQTELYSGEIAEDFAAYYTQSEQTPTLQALGVLVSGDAVLSAGGVLLQPMPDCPEDVISQLELRAPLFSDISRELAEENMTELMKQWFRGLEPQVLEETPLLYRCGCNRARMEKALIALGRVELTRMIQDEIDGAELVCHFCKNQYRFTQAELAALLEQAT